MITNRSYPAKCNECNGYGQIGDVPMSTNPYRTCPVCKGTGIIIINEIIYNDFDYYKNEEIPKLTR